MVRQQQHDVGSRSSTGGTGKTFSIHDFEVGRLLHKHKFGGLYLVRTRKEKYIFALNVWSKDKLKAADPLLMKREIDVHTLFPPGDRHPNIATMYNWFFDDTHVYLIMKYDMGMDLFTYVQTEKGGKLEELEVARIIQDLVSALLYLRGKDVLFHGLQIDNLRIDSKGKVKIADFGLMSGGTSVYFPPVFTADKVCFFLLLNLFCFVAQGVYSPLLPCSVALLPMYEI